MVETDTVSCGQSWYTDKRFCHVFSLSGHDFSSFSSLRQLNNDCLFKKKVYFNSRGVWDLLKCHYFMYIYIFFFSKLNHGKAGQWVESTQNWRPGSPGQAPQQFCQQPAFPMILLALSSLIYKIIGLNEVISNVCLLLTVCNYVILGINQSLLHFWGI